MWKTATIVCAAAACSTPLAIEIVRVIVHRWRVKKDGLGGTQDICMWGSFAGFALAAATLVFGAAWWLSR